MGEEKKEKKHWSYWVIRVLIILAIITVIVLAIIYRKEVGAKMTGLVTWISKNPAAGAFSLIGIYVVATVLFIPGSILTLGAGWAFN